MRKLYHYPLCPFSRQARILLKEYNLEFVLTKEEYWLRRPEFLVISHAGELPILLEESGEYISDINAIIEYLQDISESELFFSENAVEKAEVRRLISWFNNKFYREVTKYIINEKLIRLFTKSGAPKSELIRAAKTNLIYHMDYMSKLISEREFLANDKLSIADFVAASHLSVLDYFGEVSWKYHPKVQNWYSIIKSRPSFRPILSDSIAGFMPSKTYAVLDF